MCVGELIYFSGNKETLDINQFKRSLFERSFFWDFLEVHIKF